jgi:hypothetical protein
VSSGSTRWRPQLTVPGAPFMLPTSKSGDGPSPYAGRSTSPIIRIYSCDRIVLQLLVLPPVAGRLMMKLAAALAHCRSAGLQLVISSMIIANSI